MIRFVLLILLIALGGCGPVIPQPSVRCKEYSTTEQTCYARGGGCWPSCKVQEYTCPEPLYLDSSHDGSLVCRLKKPE